MKKSTFILLLFSGNIQFLFAQNVGIGIAAPIAKLHIKGNSDTSQLVIDANSLQSNTHPLIRLRDASGNDLLHIHSDNPDNTFVGLNAGRVNNATGGGLANTFMGALAGNSSTSGYSLTALGRGALFSNTTGHDNTAIGASALYYNISGFNNVAIGRGALYQNINDDNTAIGFKALFSNTQGYGNTANGSQALVSNIDGSNNTATGSQALFSNNSGINNTANGVDALFSNTTGSENTANGALALNYNTIGNSNTANGGQALFSNTTGSDNSANGYGVLASNTSGSFNTANGTGALYSNTSGNNNTATGSSALFYNTGGSNNIAIGYNSGNSSGAPNVNNSIGIGNDGSFLNGTSNQVIIGNASTAFIGGKVNWGVVSDERIKRNIKEDVKGLDFVLKLRPVTYNISNEAINKVTGTNDTLKFTGKYDCEKITYTGFLAQEVEYAAKASGYIFSGYTKPEKGNQLYTIRYAEFVVPLVKAVQEQQQEIVDLKKQNDDLKARLDKIEKLLLSK